LTADNPLCRRDARVPPGKSPESVGPRTDVLACACCARSGIFPDMHDSLLISIGHGGYSAHLADGSTLSGYEREPERVLARMAAVGYPATPGTPVLDKTVCPEDALVALAVKGPMPNPLLPAGSMETLLSEPEPYNAERCTSLTYVSTDVYVLLWAEAGATVTYAPEVSA
jgi:hypothetical protein